MVKKTERKFKCYRLDKIIQTRVEMATMAEPHLVMFASCCVVCGSLVSRAHQYNTMIMAVIFCAVLANHRKMLYWLDIFFPSSNQMYFLCHSNEKSAVTRVSTGVSLFRKWTTVWWSSFIFWFRLLHASVPLVEERIACVDFGFCFWDLSLI